MPSSPGAAGIGVDGCRGGWCHVVLGAPEEGRAPVLEAGVTACIAPLLDRLCGSPAGASARLCVDMPLGFADVGDRPVEAALRAALPRGARNRVFPVPVRAVVEAWPLSFEAAGRRNAERTGRRLTLQAWHITGRMAELDRWLRASGVAREQVVEGHPELAFARLGGGLPPRKRTAEGRAWRLACLARHVRDPEVLLAALRAREPRARVADDDVLDACVLAVTAALGSECTEWVPAPPPLDARGLRMAVLAPRGPGTA